VFRASSWKLAYQFIVAVRLATALVQYKCTHLHIHFAHVPAQIGMYASALANVPFTITAHANDIFERGALLFEKADRAARFLTISEFNRGYLERLGLPRDKLKVVRCGVSFEMLARPQWNMNKTRFRIGTLGRLVEKKGVDVLIRSIGLLRDKSYGVQLSIAGDGPLHADLEKLVRDLKLTGHVVFEGSLPHSEVAGWMQELDVFVLACKADGNGDMDGIPVVLMEAMSQQVPVISTRISGIPELVSHMQTGLLAEPNDAESLAIQIDMLLSDSGITGALVKNAQVRVIEEFSPDVNLDRLVSVFSSAKLPLTAPH
jgi:glycosyltransferase involved in cell wall biosynthesis